MASPRDLGEALRRHGLTLPGAREDHPWGETVLKAKDKVFVFLGRPGPVLHLSLKLPRSGERLLDQDFAAPTGYGLGKSGWVTLTIESGAGPSETELRALLEESYRAVAPKTLVKQLDGGVPRAAAPEKATLKKAMSAKAKPEKATLGKKPPARKA